MGARLVSTLVTGWVQNLDSGLWSGPWIELWTDYGLDFGVDLRLESRIYELNSCLQASHRLVFDRLQLNTGFSSLVSLVTDEGSRAEISQVHHLSFSKVCSLTSTIAKGIDYTDSLDWERV